MTYSETARLPKMQGTTEEASLGAQLGQVAVLLLRVTEIECIGFVVENSAPQLSELTTRITEIARQPLVPPFVEIAMQMVVNIRIQVVNEAKQRGFFQNIVVEDFVDTTLFRDMNLFNLYSQFQEENEREFQNKR